MESCLRITTLTFVYLTIVTSGFTQDDDEFTLVREEDSIRIYERWIIFKALDPPQDAREVKGEFFVQTTMSKALDLLKDEKWIMTWQKHVTEFKVYPQSSDTTWLEYSYHDIPWPVSDQDHFLIYRIQRKDANEVFITFESTKNDQLAPVRDGVTRMNLLGSWVFRKISDKKIKGTYSIISQPSSIPRIFTDPVIRRNLMSTIKAYIKILEDEDL